MSLGTPSPPAPVTVRLRTLDLPFVDGEERYVGRVLDHALDPAVLTLLRDAGIRPTRIGVTAEFRRVVDHFAVPDGHTPAGFRVTVDVEPGGLLRVDLMRDISYDADGVLRPTNVLLSADSANPYEIAPVAPLVANLTCNPGIIYDLFLNNPAANVGHLFKDRDEVMTEIGRVLGPGCDISVELNDPFDPDFARILDEAEKLRDILSSWRVVIKVPHMGPVNADNVGQLLSGSGRVDTDWRRPATVDAFRGHDLALRLRAHGFRVNFTLMFEPYQAQLALQARPTFINAFVRHRLMQTHRLADLLAAHAESGDEAILVALRDYLLMIDMLPGADPEHDLEDCRAMAAHIVAYRGLDTAEGADGLDAVRHNLRVLRQANLPDTRLIVCSMEGEANFPDVDRLLASDEFADMSRRVVVTAEPAYLARFTSTSQVVSYQRRFMTAARGQT